MGGSDHCYFFVCSSDRRCTHSNSDDVNLAKTRYVRFAWLWSPCFVLIEQTNSTAITRIGKLYHLFAPWNTTWHSCYPFDPRAQAKMAGIVNKVYCGTHCGTRSFLAFKVANVKVGPSKFMSQIVCMKTGYVLLMALFICQNWTIGPLPDQSVSK